MRDSQLKLKDKTLILAGPLSDVFQNMATTLTEYGADISFVTSDIRIAEKFASNISDAKEGNPHFGRAIAVESRLDTEQDLKDTISRVAEALGGIDGVIDGHIVGKKAPLPVNLSPADLEEFTQNYLKESQQLIRGVLPFLTQRKRGRVIGLFHGSIHNEVPGEFINSEINRKILNMIQSLSKESMDAQVTVNAIAMGPTENFLLKHFPKSPSLQSSLMELRKWTPGIEILDPNNLTNTVAFLASPLSSGINGQVINVNKGQF